MRTYTHRNSAVEVPVLTGSQDAIYVALCTGAIAPKTHSRRHSTAADLEMVAEKLRCDEWAEALRAHGLSAISGPDRRGDIFFVPAAVFIDDCQVYVDSEFARRLLDRLANLPAPEAIRRTIAEADAPVLSERQLRELEREADAHVRRVEFCARNARE